jgi:hypothetical protein
LPLQLLRITIHHVAYSGNENSLKDYVFPACEFCNKATRDDENLLSLVLRFTATEHSEVDRAEFRKAINAVRNNFPGVIESLELNSFEKRAALRSLGLPRISGVSLSELPIVPIPERTWNPKSQPWPST